MAERLICGDCLQSFEDRSDSENRGIGGAIIRFIIFLLVMVPLPRRNKKNRIKKKCDYCGSDFILPDTPQNREFLRPIKKHN